MGVGRERCTRRSMTSSAVSRALGNEKEETGSAEPNCTAERIQGARASEGGEEREEGRELNLGSDRGRSTGPSREQLQPPLPRGGPGATQREFAAKARRKAWRADRAMGGCCFASVAGSGESEEGETAWVLRATRRERRAVEGGDPRRFHGVRPGAAGGILCHPDGAQ